MNRLTIRDIQIYFDGDVPRYNCPRPLELAAVEKELAAWQEFVGRWLEAAEPPRPAIRTSEERELLTMLRTLGKDFKRTFGNQVEPIFRDFAWRASELKFPHMTPERRDAVIDEAIAAL